MTRRLSIVVLLAPALVFLTAFFVAPVLGFLAQGVFAPDGTLTLSHFERILRSGTYTQVMSASLKISFWVTLVSIIVGYPAAYVLASADKSRRSTWALFILLPFWSSFLVRTFAWIVILGRQGPINAGLVASGATSTAQELLYSWGAVVVGMANVLVPFAILTMVGVMEGIDRGLVRAAGTLGARPVQAFFRIYLPLSLPGVTAATLLVFITALGFFIAPALLGSVRETMISQVLMQQVLELNNWPFAAILCLMLLASALLIFWLYDRLVGLSSLAGDIRNADPNDIGLFVQLGRVTAMLSGGIGDGLAWCADRLGWNGTTGNVSRGTKTAAIAVILFLIAPLLFLIPISVSTRAYVAWPPVGFTLQWYAEVLASPLWGTAALRSVFIAVATSFVCFIIAAPAAFAFLKLSGRTSAALFALLVSPLIIPRMVIAIALFYVYARLGLVGTTLGLVIGHTVVALPFFFIAVIAVLKTYDRRLDHAAASLGASPMATVRYVTLPLIATGIISAMLFAFVISLDELNIALFSAAGLQSTLPKLMWDEATLRFSPLLAAVSTLVLLVMSGIVLLASRLQASTTART